MEPDEESGQAIATRAGMAYTPAWRHGMSIRLGGYYFEGPFEEIDALRDATGVYAVLAVRGNAWREEVAYRMVDVREAEVVKLHAAAPDRIQRWAEECRAGSSIHFAVLYTPGRDEIERQIIELELRNLYRPPCGNRHNNIWALRACWSKLRAERERVRPRRWGEIEFET
jgi:hypothetical protein